MNTRSKTVRILLIEDNPGDVRLIREMLSETTGAQCELECVDRFSAGIDRLSQGEIDLVLLDLGLPDSRGLETFTNVYAKVLEVPIVVLTGLDDETRAVEAVRRGAQDYLVKGRVDSTLLGRAVQYAIERNQAEKRIKHLNSVLKAIRNVNQLMIVEQDRDNLLQKACDALVDARGYEAAWLGVLADDKRFAMVKGSGFGEDVARFCQHVMGGDHPPCIRNGLAQKDAISVMDRPMVCGDCFFKDTCAGKEAAVIRIERDSKLFGLLAILLAPGVFIDDEEKDILREVSGDIAFCLYSMETDEALEESEKKYRDLYQEAPIAYFRIGTDGIIAGCNKMAEKVSGYKSEQLIGKAILDLFPAAPDGKARAKAICGRFLNGETIRHERVRMIREDGSLIWGSLTVGGTRDRSGKKIERRLMVSDITEHVNMEIQLQQAQKMQAIGTLAGGIAHDFNNLLAVIIGYTELAMGGVPADSLTYSNLDEVLKAGLRAKDLVQQILTFTRGGEEERGPVQIDLIVKEALKLLRSSLPTTIEIRRDIASANMVFGDATQIHQVLMNLCANASHAMNDKGGVLEVRLQNADFGVRSVELGEDKEHSTFRNPKSEIEPEPGSYVDLSVRDTGCGIAPENLDKIFDPYFTTREIGRGTGLGLAVVHGIVRKFAGTITVESEVGKGTTIHVYLPAIKRQVAKEPKEIEPLPTGDERILFVDDEQALADMGKQMLGVLGYDVVSRTSSVEALELFRVKHDRFDVVITDMTMPNMTGDKLAKEMIKIRPDIPIILCTGYSERISEEKAMAMGIRGFAMKPLVMLDLAKIIRKVL
jgi:PAS domain S-box-containing protein